MKGRGLPEPMSSEDEVVELTEIHSEETYG